MIGSKRLQQIAAAAKSSGWRGDCRGEFVLAAQRELYGSGASALSAEELREVLAYLASLATTSARPGARAS